MKQKTVAQFNVSFIKNTVSYFVFAFSVPRPEETEVEDNTTDSRTNTVAVIEGETVFEDTYVKSVETEIVIDRTFKTPGYVYNLSLIR